MADLSFEDLDLDNLEQYDIRELESYCEEEGIKVSERTKDAFIDAILDYNEISESELPLEENLDLDNLAQYDIGILKDYCIEEGLRVYETKSELIQAILRYNDAEDEYDEEDRDIEESQTEVEIEETMEEDEESDVSRGDSLYLDSPTRDADKYTFLGSSKLRTTKTVPRKTIPLVSASPILMKTPTGPVSVQRNESFGRVMEASPKTFARRYVKGASSGDDFFMISGTSVDPDVEEEEAKMNDGLFSMAEKEKKERSARVEQDIKKRQEKIKDVDIVSSLEDCDSVLSLTKALSEMGIEISKENENPQTTPKKNRAIRKKRRSSSGGKRKIKRRSKVESAAT